MSQRDEQQPGYSDPATSCRSLWFAVPTVPVGNRLSRWTITLSAIGSAATAVIVLSTYLPGTPFVPTGLVLLLFVGVFPTFFIALWRAGYGGRRIRLWDILDGVPGLAVLGCVALLIISSTLVVGPAVSNLPGQPEIDNGRYEFNDHGQLIPATKAAYEHGVALNDRVFGGGALIFYTVAAVLSWGITRRTPVVPP